jgi:hypothetical protein
MNCASMQSMLRRRLQDTTSGIDGTGNWSRAELLDLLNLGLSKAQKAIQRVSPNAFTVIDVMNIEALKEFYQKPDGIWTLRQLRYRGDTNSRYRNLRRADYVDREAVGDVSLGSGGAPGGDITYSDFGTYVAISPVPAAQIVAGLQWIYTNTLSVSADTDVPALHIGLHGLPVYWAHRLALGETGELQEARAEVEALIAGELADIPDYYPASGGGQNEYLVPNIRMGY